MLQECKWMTKTHDKQCVTPCLQHHFSVLFHCFPGFSQLFDPQKRVAGGYPITRSQKIYWYMVLVSLHLLFGSVTSRNNDRSRSKVHRRIRKIQDFLYISTQFFDPKCGESPSLELDSDHFSRSDETLEQRNRSGSNFCMGQGPGILFLGPPDRPRSAVKSQVTHRDTHGKEGGPHLLKWTLQLYPPPCFQMVAKQGG